uniref:DUF4806 domain-containing protein n=1 Tax=Macrostomum lignano TaxID=282301 RepID=A0A1I8FLF7_9PLAT
DTIPYPGEYGINSPSGMQTVLALSQVQTNLADTPTKPLSQVYDRQLADCTTFEHLKSVQEKCGCTIEGLVKTHSGRRPDEDYCHDLLGAQDTKQLPKLLSEINQFFQRDLLCALPAPAHRQEAVQLPEHLQLHHLRLLRISEPLAGSKFPNSRRSKSDWPGLAAMLKSRIKEIDTNLLRLRAVNPAFDTNHALNHSIAYHGVNLSECLDDRLNKSLDRFDSDEHCQQVHSIIRQSFLQLRVYPKTLTVRQLYEERSYELVNLFSDLGWHYGPYGSRVSVVTLCEFGEISLIVASYYVRLLIRRLALALGHPRSAAARKAKPREKGQPTVQGKRGLGSSGKDQKVVLKPANPNRYWQRQTRQRARQKLELGESEKSTTLLVRLLTCPVQTCCPLLLSVLTLLSAGPLSCPDCVCPCRCPDLLSAWSLVLSMDLLSRCARPVLPAVRLLPVVTVLKTCNGHELQTSLRGVRNFNPKGEHKGHKKR